MPTTNRDQTHLLRQRLKDDLKSRGLIETERVEAAFRKVPRHLFVSVAPLDKIYSDQSFITKRQNGVPISSSSQPAIMAVMLEQLGLEPGHRVLEIGAGTGYNAALIAHIVGESGHVVTLDIDEDIVSGAREHLSKAGFENVQVNCADGGFGYSDDAPYDRIILTVGAWDIAPGWSRQLKRGGRLLLPLSLTGHTQKSIAFQHDGDHLESVSVRDCGFMFLRGAFAGPERHIPLGPEPGLNLSVFTNDAADVARVYALLTGPSQDRATGIELTADEAWSWGLWLSLRESNLCSVWAEGEMAERAIVPGVLQDSGGWKFSGAGGFLGGDSIALAALVPGINSDASAPAELTIRSYGPGYSLVQRLLEQALAWDEAGRPTTQVASIRAYPFDSECAPGPDETLIPKRFTKLVVDWQDTSMSPAGAKTT